MGRTSSKGRPRPAKRGKPRPDPPRAGLWDTQLGLEDQGPSLWAAPHTPFRALVLPACWGA